jgi:uncharacterized membrane protein
MSLQSFKSRFGFRDRIKVKLRVIFVTGILVVVPFVITVWALKLFFTFVDGILGPYFEQIFEFRIPGLGILTIILLTFVVGFLTTNVLGQRIVKILEGFTTRIPVIGNIYKASKQLMESVSSKGDKPRSFERVALIPMGQTGIHILGFITSETVISLANHENHNVKVIFLPNAPTPITGYVVIVPADRVIELDMSVEEGIKMIVSGGVVTPPEFVELFGGATPPVSADFSNSTELTNPLELEK